MEGGLGGDSATCSALSWLLVLSLLPTKMLDPSGVVSPVGGLVYVLGPCGSLQQILLWGSPATATPTGFYSQSFWSFISLCWNPGLCGLSHSPVVPPGLSACKCGTPSLPATASPSLPASALPSLSSSCHLAFSPLHPGYPSLPLLLVWLTVCSLTPWLLDFHTVWFSGSSGYFLFLNLLLSFFWLCKEAKCIYLRLHLGWKSSEDWIFNTWSMPTKCCCKRLIL